MIKKSNTKHLCTPQLPLRRSLRLARLQVTHMADGTEDVVENTQRSACESSQERAGDAQQPPGVGCSATKPVGDTPTDIRKRPTATSPTKVQCRLVCPSLHATMWIMCLGLLVLLLCTCVVTGMNCGIQFCLLHASFRVAYCVKSWYGLRADCVVVWIGGRFVCMCGRVTCIAQDTINL